MLKSHEMIFLFISILLGLTISYFISNKLDMSFYTRFVLITIVLFTIFYYLGKPQDTSEHFRSFEEMISEEEEEGDENKLLPLVKQQQEEEGDENKILPVFKKPEEPKKPTEPKKPAEPKKPEEPKKPAEPKKPVKPQAEEEEGRYRPRPSSQPKNIFLTISEEEEEERPTTFTHVMENGLSGGPTTGSAYGPLNIHISYNSQNSSNEIGTSDGFTSQRETSSKKSKPESSWSGPNQNGYRSTSGSSNKSSSDSCNSNTEGYNYDNYNSRVKPDNDWMYGSMAWTNAPDYYIPNDKNDKIPNDRNNLYNQGFYNDLENIGNQQNTETISQAQNEIYAKMNYREQKNVCPMMVNDSWSEYMSGDDISS